MTTRSGKRRVESGLPRFWQGVSMCFVAFLSAAAVIAGFLRDGGLEEAVRRAVAIKTRGRGSFETMEILPDGMLRLNGFSHGRAGVFPEIGPWRAREALLLAGPFSWPPAIKAVKLKGAGPVPVRFDPGLRDKGGPPDIPDYPLSFEDADFEIEAPPVGRLILGGCSGELSDEGSGVRAELRVSSLGGRDFPVRCRVEPGGRIRLESGAIELEGLGMHLLRALSPLAGLTGRVRIEQATLGGWPIETADAIVRLDRAGIRIGNPLDPCFIRNGSNGALSLHVERGRAEFSFPEGPGAAWFFEDGSGRREIASGIRGTVEWKAGDEGAAVTSVEISGSVAGRWALNFSAGGGDGEPRTWRWMFAPRAQMEGDMLPEPWRMAGMWRSGGPGGGKNELRAELHAYGVRFRAAPEVEASLAGRLSVRGGPEGWRFPVVFSWRVEDGCLKLGDPSAGGIEVIGARCGGELSVSPLEIGLSGTIAGMRILSGDRVVNLAGRHPQPQLRARIGMPGLLSILGGVELEAVVEVPGDWKVRIGRARPGGPEYMLSAENIPLALLPWPPVGAGGEAGVRGRCDLEIAFVQEGGRWNIVKRLKTKDGVIGISGGAVSVEGLEVEMRAQAPGNGSGSGPGAAPAAPAGQTGPDDGKAAPAGQTVPEDGKAAPTGTEEKTGPEKSG